MNAWWALVIVVGAGAVLAILLHWATSHIPADPGPGEDYGPVREARGRVTRFLWIAYIAVFAWAIGYTTWIALHPYP